MTPTPAVGDTVIYCLGAAEISPHMRGRQTEFAVIVTAVRDGHEVDLAVFPPAASTFGVNAVNAAANIPHESAAMPGRTFWRQR